MDARGYDAVAIGQVMAIILGARVVAPGLWGWLADARGDATLSLRAAALAALFAFVLVPFIDGYGALLLVMGVFSLGLSGVIPQFEANTLNHLGASPEDYGRIRLWGSVGFIAAVAGAGLLFEWLPVTSLPWLVSALLALMVLATLVTPVSSGPPVAQGGSLRQVLGRRPVLALLLACFLIQASFGPYYVFFSVYLDDLGYPPAAVGVFWALAVASEILVFLYAAKLFRRYSLVRLFQLSAAVCVLRWGLTAQFAASSPVLLLVQLTHMITFGLYHAVAVSLIHRHFTGKLQVRGQGLYSSVSFGAGGVAGSILSGYAWQHLGAAMTYYFAAAVALVAWLIAMAGMRTRREHWSEA